MSLSFDSMGAARAHRWIGLHRAIRGGAVLLAACGLILCWTGAVAAAPPVLVLNDANEPPFTNAQRSGFLDIVAGEVFRRAGLELRLVKLPAARALMLANAGSEDGELTRIAGLEAQYPNLVRVPEKLVDWTFVAFVKDTSIPARVEAIRGRAVGFVRGWKRYEQAMAGATKAITADDPAQLFRLLQRDRIEVALYSRLMGVYYLRAHGIRDVRAIGPPLYVEEMFIYLHKRHAAHVPDIASALRAMKHDGSYQRAYRQKLALYSGTAAR